MSGRIEGRIVAVDEAGNLITDITADRLAAAPRDESVQVACDEHVTTGIFGADHGQPEMTFLAILGAREALELVIVGDSAKLMLGLSVGSPVIVSW